jgi:hypothetical protein
MGRSREENDYRNAMAGRMLNSPPVPAGLSLPVIIIVFVVFWPLAIYLIWKRSNIKNIDENGAKALEVVGWIVAFAGVIGMIGAISDAGNFDWNSAYSMITFIGGGIGLILIGNKNKRAARRYKRYITIISNQGITSIDELAAAVSVSYDAAVKDLQKMLDLGFFAGAYIDAARREILLPENHPNAYETGDRPERKDTVVICKGCGANNKIGKNSVGECEFCGSPISADQA